MAGDALLRQPLRQGRASMPEYRLHFLDRACGRIAHTYLFPAASDAEAIAFAEVWKEEAPMELWFEDTRLRRWNAAKRP
jgi:hypothetical protein